MNWPLPGTVLLAGSVGLLVYLLMLRRADARRAPGPGAAESDDPLDRQIAQYVHARRSSRDAWMAATAVAGVVLSLLWLATATPRDEGGRAGAVVLNTAPTDSQTKTPPTDATASTPPGPTAENTPPGLSPTLLAVFGAACLTLLAGVCLVGFGRGPWAKTVGTMVVGVGLTSNGYAVKELKFGDLFKFETHIDKASLELEFGKRLQAISEFGPQPLGAVEDFESGRADIRPHMKDTLGQMCRKWVEHGGQGQRGLLLVIGSTDRVRLAGATSSQYESNVGLARARAEQVKSQLLECDIPSSQVATLVSGPRYTPASASVVTAQDAAKDRSVAVWALWSVPAQTR